VTDFLSDVVDCFFGVFVWGFLVVFFGVCFFFGGFFLWCGFLFFLVVFLFGVYGKPFSPLIGVILRLFLNLRTLSTSSLAERDFSSKIEPPTSISEYLIF